MQFEVGDVVRLKSGGHRMTVEAVRTAPHLDPLQPKPGQVLDCVWFRVMCTDHFGNQTWSEAEHGEFPAACVDKA